MRLVPRARPVQGVAIVETFGPEPIGAAQVDAIQARQGALLGGFTAPNPAGWGAPGAMELTDYHTWGDPQAFAGMAGIKALAVYRPGADLPVIYPEQAELGQIVLPGPGGI